MKKASRILYLVSAILGVVIIAGYVFAGCAILANGHLLDEFIKQAGYDPATVDPEVFKTVVTTVAVVIFALAVFPLISAILAVAGTSKNAGKGLHIANIVFGALGGTYVVILAAIFGLISRNRE